MFKSFGEVCSTYVKYNIEYVLGVLSRRQLEVKFDFQLGLRIWGKCAQHMEKYNIEHVLGFSAGDN